LSADAVRATRFQSRRRGYDPDDVLIFLNQVANDIQAADAERASLRAQLHSARAELEKARQGSASDNDQEPMEISVHAVDLLSQAQQIADSCVADAEQYARDLIEAARSQYREILQRAQQAASESVRDLPEVRVGAGASVPEIEYVRTYARVAQVQLRSVLDALTHEVDKLGHITEVNDYRSVSPTELDDIRWEPDNLVSLNPSRASMPEPPGHSIAPWGGI
jgi:cell division initiation protein